MSLLHTTSRILFPKNVVYIEKCYVCNFFSIVEIDIHWCLIRLISDIMYFYQYQFRYFTSQS